MTNIKILYRAVCLLIGYACGNFLTAEVVTRRITGRPCAELGTSGNPGMTNVMRNLGFRAGITVLLGDILKTVLAMVLCWTLFGKKIGRIAMFYGGFGAILGHDFPVWQHWRGGKGIACCGALLVLYSPYGFMTLLVALAVMLGSHYLCIGGVIPPAAFVPTAFLLYGFETGVLSLILTALFFLKHWPSIRLIPSGACEKVNVIGMVRGSLRR